MLDFVGACSLDNASGHLLAFPGMCVSQQDPPTKSASSRASSQSIVRTDFDPEDAFPAAESADKLSLRISILIPSFQTTWEALAILVAVRLRLREKPDYTPHEG